MGNRKLKRKNVPRDEGDYKTCQQSKILRKKIASRHVSIFDRVCHQIFRSKDTGNRILSFAFSVYSLMIASSLS